MGIQAFDFSSFVQRHHVIDRFKKRRRELKVVGRSHVLRLKSTKEKQGFLNVNGIMGRTTNWADALDQLADREIDRWRINSLTYDQLRDIATSGGC